MKFQFIYVDNLNAKRLLTTMMDKALAAGMKKKLQKTSTSSSSNSGANLTASIQNPPKLTPMTTVDATKEKRYNNFFFYILSTELSSKYQTIR